MKKVLYSLVLLLIVGLMFYSNPTKDDYEKFVRNQIENEVSDNDSAGGFNQLLEGFASITGAMIANKKTTRTNYYLFSIYEMKFGGEDYKYLGIFTSFLPLQLKNPLDDLKAEE